MRRFHYQVNGLYKAMKYDIPRSRIITVISHESESINCNPYTHQ